MLRRQRRDAARRCALPPPANPRRRASVAEVTSTPSAGAITSRRAAWSGRASGDGWRRRYSRPSIRSTASQSTNSGSASPPIRAEQGDPRGERFAPPRQGRGSRLRPAPAPAHRASRAHPRAPPRAAARARRAAFAALRATRRRGRGRHQRAVRLGELGLQPVARFLRLGARVDHAAHLAQQAPRPARTARPRPAAAASRRTAAPRAASIAASSARAPSSS